MGQRICIRWSIVFKYVTLSVSYVAREGSCHDSYFEAVSACARMDMHRAANLIHLVVFFFLLFFFFAMLEVFLRAQCFYDYCVILARLFTCIPSFVLRDRLVLKLLKFAMENYSLSL